MARRGLLREKTKWAKKMRPFLRPDERFFEKILSLFERASRPLRENDVFLRDGFETSSRLLRGFLQGGSRRVRESFEKLRETGHRSMTGNARISMHL